MPGLGLLCLELYPQLQLGATAQLKLGGVSHRHSANDITSFGSALALNVPT